MKTTPCGNGIVEGDESCDIADFEGANCGTVMMGTRGALGCAEDCTFLTEGCVIDECGNGAVDVGEDCDGMMLQGATCVLVNGDNSSGTLSCNEDCTFNKTECSSSCGNSLVEEGEECEIDVADPDACARLVGPGSTGQPGCNDCRYDVESCTQVYKQISAGGLHTCALKHDNSVRCWGAGEVAEGQGNGQDSGQSIPPTQKFESISAGGWHNCGVTPSKEIFCWGRPHGNQSSPTGGKNFEKVSSGVFHSCALNEIGEVKCWGNNSSYFRGIEAFNGITDLGSGRDRTCFLHGNKVNCIVAGDPEVRSISGSFFSINPGGGSLMCGLTTAAEDPPCWGTAEVQQTSFRSNPNTIPRGGFTSVDAGRAHACGLDENGIVSCWGRDESFLPNFPTGVRLKALSVGDFHACGLTMDGTAVCWGGGGFQYRQTDVPIEAERLAE